MDEKKKERRSNVTWKKEVRKGGKDSDKLQSKAVKIIKEKKTGWRKGRVEAADR